MLSIAQLIEHPYEFQDRERSDISYTAVAAVPDDAARSAYHAQSQETATTFTTVHGARSASFNLYRVGCLVYAVDLNLS